MLTQISDLITAANRWLTPRINLARQQAVKNMQPTARHQRGFEPVAAGRFCLDIDQERACRLTAGD